MRPACLRPRRETRYGRPVSQMFFGSSPSIDARDRLNVKCELSVRTQVRIKEKPMNVRGCRSVRKRPIRDQGKVRSVKARVQNSDRELADQRLDGGLRHRFPRSDALSINQLVPAI